MTSPENTELAFKKGDVVYLKKINGPDMVVLRTKVYNETDDILVAWFDKRDRYRTKTIDPELLDLRKEF